MKITSDLTNLRTAILILTVQMFIEWTLFRFVLLTLLTAGIHFIFKRLGFCILLLIKWFSRWNMT
jgi:hypothetical protein